MSPLFSLKVYCAKIGANLGSLILSIIKHLSAKQQDLLYCSACMLYIVYIVVQHWHIAMLLANFVMLLTTLYIMIMIKDMKPTLYLSLPQRDLLSILFQMLQTNGIYWISGFRFFLLGLFKIEFSYRSPNSFNQSMEQLLRYGHFKLFWFFSR